MTTPDSTEPPDFDETDLDQDLDAATRIVPHGMQSEAGSFAEHVVPMGGRMVGELNQVADEIGREDAAEDRLLSGIEHAVQEQPSAVKDGLDLAAITTVEPDFDASTFRTIARESFLKVREARGSGSRHENDGIVSPELDRLLDGEIDADLADNRQHVLFGLDVAQATIVSAVVADGREKIGVQFDATAESIERDATSANVISDEHHAHRWSELWQFERDPTVDSTATDTQHIASFGPDEWLFAHRGWVVTAITKLDG